RQVNRLFKIRPIERIGFVEERQNVKSASGYQPFESKLASRNELLDLNRTVRLMVENRTNAIERGDEFHGIVGADHAAAPVKSGWFEESRVGCGEGFSARIRIGSNQPVFRRGNPRALETLLSQELVHGRANCGWRAEAQTH